MMILIINNYNNDNDNIINNETMKLLLQKWEFDYD